MPATEPNVIDVLEGRAARALDEAQTSRRAATYSNTAAGDQIAVVEHVGRAIVAGLFAVAHAIRQNTAGRV